MRSDLVLGVGEDCRKIRNEMSIRDVLGIVFDNLLWFHNKPFGRPWPKYFSA